MSGLWAGFSCPWKIETVCESRVITGQGGQIQKSPQLTNDNPESFILVVLVGPAAAEGTSPVVKDSTKGFRLSVPD